MIYSPDSYKSFILSLDIVPAHYFRRRSNAKFSADAVLAHSYCVAKTRSGKTELLKLVIYNLIRNKDQDTSLLVLDPHGEFARELRRLKILEENLHDFIYVDPTIDPDHTPVFNPFEIRDRSTVSLAYSADTILDAFEQLLKDQAITGNMRRLLRHCIYALLYYDGTTMMDLLIMLQGINRNRSQKVPEFFPDEERLMNMGKAVSDPLTSNFFEFGWKDVDSRTISAVVERIDGILSHPIVRRFIIGNNGQSSFDLKSYLNSGKIVVVNLDFTRLGNIGSEAIGRLLVSEAQNISAQRNRFSREQRPKTIIFMDECQRFVSAAIERALSEFGKFNTFLFLAHQYIEQIDDGMVKAMLSNTENKIIGRNSAASMGAISSDVGVEKEELMQIKKYEFYLKSGDKDPFKFASSDLLLDKPGSAFYNTEEEARERIDTHMIRHYYRTIETHNREYNPHDLESSGNGQNGTDTSRNLAVQIDEDDF
ncbi:MAG TPA: type IV secretory system conjugative DNA transfer family protein [Bacteroidota bacterium]|nr:type IV secretory system conjugative DNA transfer family protein [Bacteroidota bacterium]